LIYRSIPGVDYFIITFTQDDTFSVENNIRYPKCPRVRGPAFEAIVVIVSEPGIDDTKRGERVK
jgi:hypothetical protein